MIETAITRLLDAAGVPYRRLEHSEPVYTIETAAAQRGVVRSEMVKSILLREAGGQRRYAMACVLGDDRLDPKAVREHLQAVDGDWRRLTFASDEEIRRMTPGERGAVAPLGLAAEIPVVFDQAIVACVNVNISSGDPWLGLELAAQDLIRLAGAQTAAIAHHGDELS
jgi:prolyl-tRNA editing enzyme YbaK/EbsC (Cys-tRNA(Pro) deacylase)